MHLFRMQACLSIYFYYLVFTAIPIFLNVIIITNLKTKVFGFFYYFSHLIENSKEDYSK